MSTVRLAPEKRKEPFGARAMMLGLATTDQIESALTAQRHPWLPSLRR